MKDRAIQEGKTRVIFDPRCRLVFAGYYFLGFRELVGRGNVSFRMKPFRHLVQKGDSQAFDHYCALVIKSKGSEKRVVIDYRDKISFNERAYEWCDLYAKINLRPGETEERFLEKTMAIGPEVAPRVWGLAGSTLMFFLNYARAFRHLEAGFREFASGYTWQRKRLCMKAYTRGESRGDYVYFDSSLWPLKYGAGPTNRWRAKFIRTCKGMDVDFQGGFYAHIQHPDIEEYGDILLDSLVPLSEYMIRIRKSAFAFNSPSTHGGHGWKLAEFMSMGKAILSTRPANDMPQPMEHGVHVHYVDREEDMEECIGAILSDPTYRKQLEEGSYRYYQEYIAPASVARRILNQPGA